MHTITITLLNINCQYTCMFTLDKMLGSAATITDKAFIAFVLTWTAGSFSTFKSYIIK